MIKQRYSVSRGVIINIIMVLILFIIAVVSINSGKMNLSPSQVFNVIMDKGTARENLIVFEFRLPRIVLSILVGIGMGTSGCVMQSLLTLKLDQHQMDFIQRWSAGSLWGDNWNYLSILAPWIIVLFIYAFYKSPKSGRPVCITYDILSTVASMQSSGRRAFAL